MAGIHALWDIENESFRQLVEAQLTRYRRPDPAECCADRALAGDGLVPPPREIRTRSLEVAASRATVWPWLAQMMRGAGIYGPPGLEAARGQSSDHLVAGIPDAAPGDRLGELLVLVIVRPRQELVWRSIGPVQLLGHSINALSLDYRLIAAGARSCWIIARVCGSTLYLTKPVARHLVDAVDLLLPASQLARIKECAEGKARRHGGTKARSKESTPYASASPDIP